MATKRREWRNIDIDDDGNNSNGGFEVLQSPSRCCCDILSSTEVLQSRSHGPGFCGGTSCGGCSGFRTTPMYNVVPPMQGSNEEPQWNELMRRIRRSRYAGHSRVFFVCESKTRQVQRQGKRHRSRLGLSSATRLALHTAKPLAPGTVVGSALARPAVVTARMTLQGWHHPGNVDTGKTKQFPARPQGCSSMSPTTHRAQRRTCTQPPRSSANNDSHILHRTDSGCLPHAVSRISEARNSGSDRRLCMHSPQPFRQHSSSHPTSLRLQQEYVQGLCGPSGPATASWKRVLHLA
mmetsp:Transcript_36675/g.86079  ORF Transcript_36675/g.86079 Transcript_36675/m.86079 type:complete len:293 (+) Transcript_36675:85-963(+)